MSPSKPAAAAPTSGRPRPARDALCHGLRSWALRCGALGGLLLGLRVGAGLAGLGAYASVLSGTHTGGVGAIYLGLLYVLLRGGASALAPPLLATAAVLAGAWWLRGRLGSHGSGAA